MVQSDKISIIVKPTATATATSPIVKQNGLAGDIQAISREITQVRESVNSSSSSSTE